METVQLSQRGNSLQLMCQLSPNLKSLSSHYVQFPSYFIMLVNKDSVLNLDLLKRSQNILLCEEVKEYAVGLFLISMNIFLTCVQRIFLSTIGEKISEQLRKTYSWGLTLPNLGEHI